MAAASVRAGRGGKRGIAAAGAIHSPVVAAPVARSREGRVKRLEAPDDFRQDLPARLTRAGGGEARKVDCSLDPGDERRNPQAKG